MSLYTYQKSGCPPPPPESISTLPPPKPPQPFKFHLLPTITSVVGLVLITFVVWPILSYEIAQGHDSLAVTDSGLLSPAAENPQASSFTAPKIISDRNFTQLNTWFPQATLNTQFTPDGPTSYLITIPKLRIENAQVSIGSLDLSESLIHYPDTALPGQLGSPVIFGHSILPQFYNPKNYISIFSLLPTLEIDDQIIVEYDQIIYTYQVSHKQEVYPEDLWVLRQDFDAKRLKLVTCVPPGLKTRRLIVIADLVKSPQ